MKFKLNDHGAVRAFLQLPGKRTSELKRTLAIMACDRLTRQAPVLTGRYRWGFNCSINGIDYTVPPPAPPEYAKTKQVYYNFDAERAIKAFMSVNSEDDVVISNSVPYAEALENGHSKQAPNGIFRVVIPELKEDLKKWAALAQGKDGGF